MRWPSWWLCTRGLVSPTLLPDVPYLMYHQPSRFFRITSTVTPFSKLISSLLWLVYGCTVTYFSSVGRWGWRGKQDSKIT